MKVRHKTKGWMGEVIRVDDNSEDFLVVWEDEIRAWKTKHYIENLVFIIPAPTRRMENA